MSLHKIRPLAGKKLSGEIQKSHPISRLGWLFEKQNKPDDLPGPPDAFEMLEPDDRGRIHELVALSK